MMNTTLNSNMADIISTLHIYLRLNFYTQDIINDILSKLSASFELFSIIYIEEDRVIQMKIKKTDMKKATGFIHNSVYYSQIYNEILKSVFIPNIESINSGMVDYNLPKYCQYLYDGFIRSMMYNVLTCSDNIVNIYL